MLVSLKALPWLFPFLRELFKRGRRRPRQYKRDAGGSSAVFLIAGFFILITVIVLFTGEKIVSLMMEKSSLIQENTTLRFARETNQELVVQLQTSNEIRGRQVDALIEQNVKLEDEISQMIQRNNALNQRLDMFEDSFKEFQDEWRAYHAEREVSSMSPKGTNKESRGKQ